MTPPTPGFSRNHQRQKSPAPCATAPEISASEASRFLLGTCLIDIQCTFVQQSAVQSSNRFVRICRVRHLHKSETAWLSRVAVGHNGDSVYRPECCEGMTKCLF